MSCCGVKETPDSNIRFEQMGCPCDTWAHLKDMFVYLKDERANVIPCKPDEFTVQWSIIDAMTYMFTVTDKLTDEIISYSVAKEYPKESPELAFERDWRFRELMYNRGVVRSMMDLLEAMEETNPSTLYKLSRVPLKEYVIHKPINVDLGVVVFKVTYEPLVRVGPLLSKDEWKDKYADVPIELPQVVDTVAAGTQVLLKRLRKVGVRFESVKSEILDDLKRFTITGYAYRDNGSDSVVKISYQEMDLNNPTLNAYNEYFTTKGPQNGYYNCR